MELKRGTLQKIFGENALKAAKKITLVAALALGTTGCGTTGLYSGGGTFGYQQPSQQAQQVLSYQPNPRLPWANDANYREEIRLAQLQGSLRIQQYEATARQNLAYCNSTYSSSMQSNAQYDKYYNKNASIWDRMASGTRYSQASTNYETCKTNATVSFQQSVLYERQSFNSTIDGLNNKYKYQYGIR